MEHLIYHETPEHEGDVLHYGMADMHEVFGPAKTAALLSGKAVWHGGGLAVCMRHAAQEKFQRALEDGDYFDAG